VTGTVISGTTRHQDVLVACMDYLGAHAPEDYQIVTSIISDELDIEYGDLVADEDNRLWSDGYLNYILWSVVFGLMDKLAPEGHYFGAHPGDGSDFGFWEIEEEEPSMVVPGAARNQDILVACMSYMKKREPDYYQDMSDNILERFNITYEELLADRNNPIWLEEAITHFIAGEWETPFDMMEAIAEETPETLVLTDGWTFATPEAWRGDGLVSGHPEEATISNLTPATLRDVSVKVAVMLNRGESDRRVVNFLATLCNVAGETPIRANKDFMVK